MRNWNYGEPKGGENMQYVISLPMRNWNVKKVYFNDFVEELLLVYLWGIETRFLCVLADILPFVISLPMRNWNPPEGGDEMPYCFVISLPMRNWNYQASRTNEFESKRLLVYLWGIETTFPDQVVEYIQHVISLPMRNWNRAGKFESYLNQPGY